MHLFVIRQDYVTILNICNIFGLINHVVRSAFPDFRSKTSHEIRQLNLYMYISKKESGPKGLVHQGIFILSHHKSNI